jgi:hypothetical protein
MYLAKKLRNLFLLIKSNLSAFPCVLPQSGTTWDGEERRAEELSLSKYIISSKIG